MPVHLKLLVLALAGTLACGAMPAEGEDALEDLPQHRSTANSMPLPAPVQVAVPQNPRVPVVDCTPMEKVGYRGGRAFPITVMSIDGRFVEVATARAYWAMQLAAAADGIELPIYSGFRSQEDQKYFHQCFKTCSCNSCSPAARPGHSKHQSGSAIDFGQWPGVVSWLNEHGREYRFFPTVRREPWHWEYRPRRSKRKQKQWPAICQRLAVEADSD